MHPDRLLKRYFPVLTLLLIAVAAYLQARGAAWLLALALAGPNRVSALPPKPDARPPVPTAPQSGQAIAERNPFDSATGAVGNVTRPDDNSARPVNVNEPLAWPSCQDVSVLIVSESHDPSWSLATLQSPSEPRPLARRVGDSIANKQVAFIGYNPTQQAPAVWLQGSGTLCQALMFRPQTAPLPAASLPAAPVAPAAPAAREPASVALLRTVRVVPEQRGGRLVGLRLFGIKPSSLLGTLGLKNGDRLESINGFEIADPAKALEAYARLRSAQRLQVRLDRSGRPLQLDLNII